MQDMMTQTTLSPKLFRRIIIDAARTGEGAIPICPYAPPAGLCGGCTFQERSYTTQIAAKTAALRGLWSADLPAERLAAIEVIGSPNPYAYRTRMDYVCSKDRFGLRRGGKYNYIVDLQECHLIPLAAFAAARALYERATALGLPDYHLRAHTGFLRYIVVRRSPDDTLLLAAVTAAPDTEGMYERALEDVAALALEQPGVLGFHWLINDTLTDLSFGRTQRIWGHATLPMRVGAYTLQIGPNTFFQNNVHLLEPLLEDVAGLVWANGARPHRIADLYGGVGTIALSLAGTGALIETVESIAESAELARQNIGANKLANVSAIHAEALAYLREQPSGRIATIVADPPRTGLGPEVCRELLRLRPERIVYVSCNALTQIEDTRMLAEGYRLHELRGYDMFPQTPHLEALALLEARA